MEGKSFRDNGHVQLMHPGTSAVRLCEKSSTSLRLFPSAVQHHYHSGSSTNAKRANIPCVQTDMLPANWRFPPSFSGQLGGLLRVFIAISGARDEDRGNFKLQRSFQRLEAHSTQATERPPCLIHLIDADPPEHRRKAKYSLYCRQDHSEICTFRIHDRNRS